MNNSFLETGSLPDIRIFGGSLNSGKIGANEKKNEMNY